MPKSASPRRWFRFSLRSLLVAVTVLAAWLGWNVNRIAHRRAAKATIEAHGGIVQAYFSAADLVAAGETCGVALASASLCKVPAIPMTRKWLGDESVSSIMVRSESDAVMALEAFPETNEIVIMTEDLEVTEFYMASDGQ